tara:strand:- start:9 stop:455 length:447 start_codon:yes stop_codon:yes gene_type:complete
MAFSDIISPVMDPLMASLPTPYNLVLVSFLITGSITLVYKFITDQNLMKELKAEMKDLQKQMKQLKDNPEKMMAVQKQVMEKNMKYMMQSLKPTLITLIPILFIFNWLRTYYTDLGNPDVLFGLSWLWIYIIFSVAISIGLRKALKIH